MRQIALFVIVAVLCAVAIVRPRIGLFGYTWFAMMRPDILAWATGTIPYSAALAAATLIGSVAHLGKFGILFSNPISRWLLVFVVLVTISAAAAVDPTLSWPAWNLFIRMLLMALIIVVFVQTEADLKSLLLITALSLGLLGLKLAIYGFVVGEAHYMDDYGDTMLSDNNMLALALAMVTPLCWYGRYLCTTRLVQLFVLAVTFGAMGGVVMTHSRGGAVSLGIAVMMIAWRSTRRFATILLLLVCTVPTVYVVRDSYVSRMSTITADEDKADLSIQSRLNHARAAYAMWIDYPLFGVGFGMGNYMLLVSNYLGYEDRHVAHNTYCQILADNGIFAFAAYVGLLFGTIFYLGRSAKRVKIRYPGREVYPYALQTALMTFAVGSYFLSRDSYDLLYIALMLSAAWRTIERYERFTIRQPANESNLSNPDGAGDVVQYA